MIKLHVHVASVRTFASTVVCIGLTSVYSLDTCQHVVSRKCIFSSNMDFAVYMRYTWLVCPLAAEVVKPLLIFTTATGCLPLKPTRCIILCTTHRFCQCTDFMCTSSVHATISVTLLLIWYCVCPVVRPEWSEVISKINSYNPLRYLISLSKTLLNWSLIR